MSVLTYPLHFYPNVNPILNKYTATKLVKIVLQNFRNILLENYDYCYGFNKTKKAKRLK